MAEAGGRAGAAEGLRADALGGLDAIVLGMAGSAPAYSIATTTAALVAAVGTAGPAALLACGIPMIGIALAYRDLGARLPHAGAAYAWVGRALGPVPGYLAGWALVLAATLFMAAGSLPAGSVTLSLVAPALADDTTLVTAVGAAWFALMAVLVVVGARRTARVQWAMSGLELLLLCAFGLLGAWRALSGARLAFSWRWLIPAALPGPGSLASGVLVAAFSYWGWDVTANLGEETRRPRHIPGAAGLGAMVAAMCLFVAYALLVDLFLPARVVGANAGDVLLALGRELWPGAGGGLMVLAVLMSTVATLATTLLQASRTLYAMGRDGAMPAALAAVHPRWRTPWTATAAVAAAALALFVASDLIGSVGAAISAALAAISLLIVVYYSLAAAAAVVEYRRRPVGGASGWLRGALWPALGGAFMLACGVEDVTQLSPAAVAVGVGALLVGLAPYALRPDRARSPRAAGARALDAGGRD